MVRPFRRHISPGCGVMMTGLAARVVFLAFWQGIQRVRIQNDRPVRIFKYGIHKLCRIRRRAEPAAHKARTRLVDSIKHRFARRFRGVIQREDCLRHGGSQDWVQRMRMAMFKSPTPLQRAARAP